MSAIIALAPRCPGCLGGKDSGDLMCRPCWVRHDPADRNAIVASAERAILALVRRVPPRDLDADQMREAS